MYSDDYIKDREAILSEQSSLLSTRHAESNNYTASRRKYDSATAAQYLHLYRLSNIAIPISYFCIGIAINFIVTPVSYYVIETLNQDASAANIINTVLYLPWSFKIFYGMFSDCQTIFAQKRKPYFIIGWLLYIFSNLALAALGTPSMEWVVLLVFTQTIGCLLSDVMTDTLIVERSKFEDTAHLGTLQTDAYIIRFLGSILGSVGGAVLYNKDEWGWGLSIAQIFIINALVPLILLGPFVYPLVDPSYLSLPTDFFQQCEDIWTAVKRRAVWKPMSFVYLYNVFQVSNSAWDNYLIESLHFSDFDLGVISTVGSITSFIGLVLYKQCFFHTDWHRIYVTTTVVNFLFTSLQMMLIFGINKMLHLPNLLFATGDDSVLEFMLAIQFIPTCKMFIALCPDGSEGASYAMFTTMSNIAGTVAYNIGTYLAKLWDVSNEALADGRYGGMWRLVLLTSCLQLFPLVFLALLPKGTGQVRRWSKVAELGGRSEYSVWGGLLFLLVLFGSIVETILETLFTIYF